MIYLVGDKNQGDEIWKAPEHLASQWPDQIRKDVTHMQSTAVESEK